MEGTHLPIFIVLQRKFVVFKVLKNCFSLSCLGIDSNNSGTLILLPEAVTYVN